MTPDRLDLFAAEMYDLFREHRLTRRHEVPITELTIADAYDVQDRVIERRRADGETPVGWKVGCTSRAVQRQFGLDTPVAARLMAPSVFESGAVLSVDDFHGCAIESEFVLRIGTDIDPARLTDDDLLASIASVTAGIELHHYTFVHGAPTAQELIASNAIHAGVVLAEHDHAPVDDLELEGVGAWVDGVLVESAIAAEILGAGPLASLRWLARHLDGRGRQVRAGDLVLPGSAVGLVRVAAGSRVVARFTRLGHCEAVFV